MTYAHTPEPWYIARRLGPASAPIVLGADNLMVADPIGTSEADYAAARVKVDANAARIVACVNACAGINPEAVQVWRDVMYLLANGSADGNQFYTMDWAKETARAAIALAEGKGEA